MKNVSLQIISNVKLNHDTYLLKLKGDLDNIKNAGEFIEMTIPGYYLRRPFSIFELEKNCLSILYKVVGEGTKTLASLNNTSLDCLIGLGNGFNIEVSANPLLIGGGIGIAPLYELSKRFSLKGIKPTILLGFKNKSEVVLIDEFSMYCDVIVTTDDGSYGFKGNSLDYLKNNNLFFDYYYSCGPIKMLEAISKFNKNGFLSLEARMGCGFGCCMGCSIKTTLGFKRVCKEGPVFTASEVIFDE